MKNRDERLESHIRELENFYHSPPETKSKPDIGAHDRRKLESAFEKAHARRTPRGRPPAWQSRNECTYQSFEVFVFVVGEMRTFKKRHGTKRVSAKVRDALIEFAMRECPLANVGIVLDHIRKDQRLLPIYDKPTSFLLVRFGYEGMVIAAPADQRK